MTLGIDHFLAAAAIVVTVILILLCVTTGKDNGREDGRDRDTDRKHRKTVFSLPVVKDETPAQTAESSRLMDRLGLSRSSGCVVTLSFSSTSITTNHDIINVVKVLSMLTKFSNVFLVLKAKSSDEEDHIWNDIQQQGIPVEKHRVIFHETTVGKVAMLRQLKPQLHIDFDTEICSLIVPHIRAVIEFLAVNSSASSSQALVTTKTDGKGNSWKIIGSIEEVLTVTLPANAKGRI